MCAYEEYIFTCGHARYGLVCYCHRARNHPTRRCDFVKTLDKIWHQGRLCDPCQAAWAACHQSQGQGQGEGQRQGQGQARYRSTTICWEGGGFIPLADVSIRHHCF
ncbi:predicted protein [Chaetomium globosum CBS 148.51]|uniref:Uncharacterized protein n=1 Tax=Chaetomium globosum (strain ATCC 6205 / CBS 148.51 / DSM 1962 / NBRC 6347 / NRRL 1970) TaxID=306901 RepID=Q2HGK2_CHAGB|nr:uncharacterized protein CHGG_00652 [Chaetomium globosum CBS 148.51]EAQ92417.1 predicted protein [Chaetomium globosum CBS 148.51]